MPGLEFAAFRAPSEAGSLKLTVLSSGGSVGYARPGGGADAPVGFSPTVQVGDVLEIRKSGTAYRYRLLRGGAEVASKSGTLSAGFAQSTCAIKTWGAGWEFDDLVITNATA